jgi:hypothetical protein
MTSIAILVKHRIEVGLRVARVRAVKVIARDMVAVPAAERAHRVLRKIKIPASVLDRIG